MAQLYAPEVPGKIPAQYGETFQFNYTPSRANPTSNLAIKVKNLTTDTVYFEAKQERVAYTDVVTGQTYVLFQNLPTSDLIVGQYYKIQLAHIANNDPTLSPGVYSAVGVFKYTKKPELTVDWENVGNSMAVTCTYINSDLSEKIDWYQIDIYNINGDFITSSERTYNINLEPDLNGATTFTFCPDLLQSGTYKAKCILHTFNELVCEAESAAYNLTLSDEWDDIIDPYECSYEEGMIKFHLLAATTDVYKLVRTDENMQWHVVLQWQAEAGQSYTILDTSCEQYKQYFYGIQKTGHEILALNGGYPIVCDFEDCFLSDATRQLAVRFNPKIDSFKVNLQESKTDTIGGTFPIFFRNGNLRYHEFSIGGLISMHLDNNAMFLPSRNSNQQQRDSTTSINFEEKVFGRGAEIYEERQFKQEVYKWLTNGEPKLFRSPTEGNYIVRLMNISLTPENKLSRMLHSFQATAYEIAEYNDVNLLKYNFAARLQNAANIILPPTEIPEQAVSVTIYDGGSVDG